jgi:hypothetical protein
MMKCVICGKEAEYVLIHSYCEECYFKVVAIFGLCLLGIFGFLAFMLFKF